MRHRFTFLMAFCLLAFHAFAQTVETVATGLSSPVGMVLDGNNLYVSEYAAGKISKVNLTQSLPAPATTVLSGIPTPTGLLVIGEYLYFCLDGSTLPGGTTSIGRVNLTAANPVIEAVTTNVTPSYGAQVLLKNGNDLYISAANDLAGHQGVHKINLSAPFPQAATPVLTGAQVSGMDLRGNELYFSFYGGSTVKKIDISQPNPVPVTVISGLNGPDGLTFNGNFLYIAEFDVDRIIRIDVTQPTPVPQTVVTGVDGPSLTAFDGTILYFAEFGADKASRIVINQPVFSAIGTVCDNANATLGGASPTGGTYSGPGVSNDGNGETFTFNPAAAGGLGTYTVTYTLPNGVATTSTLTVVAAPVIGVFGFVTDILTPPSPLPDPAAGPAGGTYSGSGVLPGNIFDASQAGIGVHLLTYTYTNANGCTSSGVGTITVNAPGNDACSGATDLNSLLGGPQNTPQVSTLYNNTGFTATGDPAAAQGCFYQNDPLGHTIWYTFTGDGNTYRIRSVQCNATNYIPDGDTQVAIYTGDCGNLTLVTCNDDQDANNNILNISVDIPTQVGQTYRMLVDGYSNAQGEFCLEVTNLTTPPALAGDACAGALSLNSLLGGPANAPQVSTLYNNTGFTTTGDPAAAPGCFYQNDPLAHTIWYTFTGDGNTYRIRSVQCTATNYIPDGDTQVAIYTGDCGNLTLAACNDDQDPNNNILNISVDIPTQAGQTYRMLVDGYGNGQGEFCLEVTKLAPSAVTEISQTDIRVAPNPTTGLVQLTGVNADLVQVFDVAGRLVFEQRRPGATLDLSGIPAGLYVLKITEKAVQYSARVVKQ